jgi:hypothetical protein
MAVKSKIKKSTFKRKGVVKKLYQVEFNNDSRNFDRISGTSKEDAKKRMKKFYPSQKITKVTLLG